MGSRLKKQKTLNIHVPPGNISFAQLFVACPLPNCFEHLIFLVHDLTLIKYIGDVCIKGYLLFMQYLKNAREC